MTDLRKAAQQALEALEPYADIKPRDWKTDREKLWRAYDDLRAALALAQPAQAGVEPVAWMDPETKVLYDHDTSEVDKFHGFAPTVPLYTHPPARVPLTEDEIDKLPWGPHEGNPLTFAEGLRDFARAVLAAYEAKNSIGGGK